LTTHVLIACSKSKVAPPEERMIWTSSTVLESWNKEWHDQKTTFRADELYTGRSFKQQLKIATTSKEVKLYIISAGAGLIPFDVEIPSYESTFRLGMGPKVTEWHLLPFGGVTNLELDPKDKIISFAPPKYHQALLNDPDINSIKNQLIVPSTSPLSPIASSIIQIHPRSKEVLGISSSDLNTEFLRMFLSNGLTDFHSMEKECDHLPPKVERKPISDDELLSLVKSLKSIKTLNGLVRHLRDNLKIKASVERISDARKLAIDD
tara:strand:+ start:5461 stop:6252 length:792 start_codon:yes stop_codon:yes gene_type:complete